MSMEKVVIRYSLTDPRDNGVQVGGFDISRVTSGATIRINAEQLPAVDITLCVAACDITTEGIVTFNMTPVPEQAARAMYEMLKTHFEPERRAE